MLRLGAVTDINQLHGSRMKKKPENTRIKWFIGLVDHLRSRKHEDGNEQCGFI